MLKKCCLLFAIGLLNSCYAVSTQSTEKTPPRYQAPSQPTSMGMSILKTADLVTQEGFVLEDGDFFKPFKISHSAFLIQHPKGDILFDTGLGKDSPDHFAKDMPWWASPFFHFEHFQPLKKQLQSSGYPVDQIKAIYLSHLHWDHAGSLHEFPYLPVYTPQIEQQVFNSDAFKELGYFASQQTTHEILWENVTFSNSPYEGFAQSHDIYQDGTLVLVPLPGHTPGSVGLFVNLPSGKRYFLSGDTSWAQAGITQIKPKFWLSRMLVDKDDSMVMQQLRHLHQMLKMEPELTILPTHDAQAQEKVGYYPLFLR